MQTEIVILMTESEARKCADAIKAHLTTTRELVYSLYSRDGWKSLGYKNWTDCVNNEFSASARRIWQELSAAQIETNLLNPGSVVGQIPEKHLRPLTQLEPEQQRDAWRQAVETAPEGKVTAAHVQAVVDEIQHKPRPENIHVSDDSYEWYTPQEYIDAARSVMGSIDLDPASTIRANEIIQAAKFYTKEQNGLIQPWLGRVWLNPPYSMPLVEQFTGKAIDEYKTGNIGSAIILVNNATDTDWFQRLLDYPVCFPDGRVKFWTTDGPNLGARQGQAIFYLGNQIELFAKIFNKFGKTKP
jgi:phage N-6-adenine-methyltransferase